MKTNLVNLIILSLGICSNIKQANAQCFNCVSQTLLNSGLVACYTLDGNANDMISSTNNGTASGTVATTNRFGRSNAAFQFNGNASISLPGTNFQLNNYTYSAWVKINANPTSGNISSILSFGNTSALGDQNIFIANNYSEGQTGFDAVSYTNPVQFPLPPDRAFTGTVPNTGVWYHIVSTRNNVTGKLTLFVNGTKATEVSLSSNTAGYALPLIGVIGARVGNVNYFNGIIDDVRIYNRALSLSEVASLFNLPDDVLTFNPDAGTDRTVCYGDSVQLNATGGSSYAWMPSNWLNNPNIANPKFKAYTTTKYYVTIGNGVCSVTDSVTIRVDSLGIFSVGSDTNVCRGDSIRLQAKGANSYTWTPSLGLSTTTTANPKASPLKTIDYIVKGQSGICSAYDTIRVTVCDCSKSITYDTLKVFDTVTVYQRIYDTITVYQQVYDTITVYQQVYDTIKYAVADTLIIDIFSGINNPNTLLNSLKAYPNPAHDELIIDNGNYWLMPNYSLQITNSLGQIVLLNAINQQKFVIATGTLGGVGTYFLQIINPNQQPVETRKIIIR